MNLVESATLVLHVLTALAVCGFVLLQHGKGADMGAAFGSGSSTANSRDTTRSILPSTGMVRRPNAIAAIAAAV